MSLIRYARGCVEVIDLEPGIYAVSAVHDRDESGDLNTGTFGNAD